MPYYGPPPTSLVELLKRTWVGPAVFGFGFAKVVRAYESAPSVVISKRLSDGCYSARGSRIVTVCSPNLAIGQRVRVRALASGAGRYEVMTTKGVLIAGAFLFLTILWIYLYYRRFVKDVALVCSANWNPDQLVKCNHEGPRI
jgi:hypothetical protein